LTACWAENVAHLLGEVIEALLQEVVVGPLDLETLEYSYS